MQFNSSIGCTRRILGKWAAMAAVCAVPVLMAGCNGGNGGFNPPTQNGTFTGASANLGANRSGNLTIRSFSDNTINGTLDVDVTVPLVKNATSSNGLVALPIGQYNFTGTRTATTFTAIGTIPGTNSTFHLNGTLSTSATAGSFTISGTLNGEAFNFTGAINAQSGGGGGGNNTFSFSANQSNANTATLTSNANAGTSLLLPIGNVFLLNGTFASATSAASTRLVSISVVKSSFAVGDTFTLSDDGASSSGSGAVTYSEGAPPTKAWVSHSGTVKITARSGNDITLQIINAQMQPAPVAGPGQTNQATGEFTLNGSGKATFTGNGL